MRAPLLPAHAATCKQTHKNTNAQTHKHAATQPHSHTATQPRGPGCNTGGDQLPEHGPIADNLVRKLLLVGIYVHYI